MRKTSRNKTKTNTRRPRPSARLRKTGTSRGRSSARPAKGTLGPGSSVRLLKGAARKARSSARPPRRSSSRPTREDRLSRQMSTLDAVSKLVFSCTRDDRVLEKCLTLLKGLVPFQNGAVFIMREDTGRLDLEATLGYPQDLIERVQFDLGQGLSAWAAREKRAVLVKELSRPSKDGMPALGSFLAVPIVAGGRSVGVITMGHPEPGAFAGDHKRILQLFCTLISGSVFAMLLERRRALAAPSSAETAA